MIDVSEETTKSNSFIICEISKIDLSPKSSKFGLELLSKNSLSFALCDNLKKFTLFISNIDLKFLNKIDRYSSK